MQAISIWCAWVLIASLVFDRSGKHARHYGNPEKSGDDDLRQDKPDWDCHGRAAAVAPVRPVRWTAKQTLAHTSRLDHEDVIVVGIMKGG